MGLNDEVNTLEIRLQLPGMAFQATRMLQDRVDAMKDNIREVVDAQLKTLDLEGLVREEVRRQIHGVIAQYVENSIRHNREAMDRVSEASRGLVEDLTRKLLHTWEDKVEQDKQLEEFIAENKRKEQGDAGPGK